MKTIKVYGSSFWPGCATAKEVLSQHNIAYDYVNITSGMKELKEYLVLRDTLDLYKDVRGKATVGIPMLAVTEDGITHYYRGVPEDLSLLK